MAKRSSRPRGGQDERSGLASRDTARPVTLNAEFGRAISLGERRWYESTRDKWPKVAEFKGDTYLGFTRKTFVHFWDTEADPKMPKHCRLPETLEGYNFKSLSTAVKMRPDGKLLALAPEPGSWLPFGNRIPVLAWLFGQWADDYGSLGKYHPDRRGTWRVNLAYQSRWASNTSRGDLQYTGQLYLYGYTKNEFFPPYSWGEELRREREEAAQRLREEQERIRQEQLEMERQLQEQERNFAPEEHRDETRSVDAFIVAAMATEITDPEELARQLRRLGLSAPPTQDLSTVPPPRRSVQRTVIPTNTKARSVLRRKRKK